MNSSKSLDETRRFQNIFDKSTKDERWRQEHGDSVKRRENGGGMVAHILWRVKNVFGSSAYHDSMALVRVEWVTHSAHRNFHYENASEINMSCCHADLEIRVSRHNVREA